MEKVNFFFFSKTFFFWYLYYLLLELEWRMKVGDGMYDNRCKHILDRYLLIMIIS
jgi:hypothetical protein